MVLEIWIFWSPQLAVWSWENIYALSMSGSSFIKLESWPRWRLRSWTALICMAYDSDCFLDQWEESLSAFHPSTALGSKMQGFEHLCVNFLGLDPQKHFYIWPPESHYLICWGHWPIRHWISVLYSIIYKTLRKIHSNLIQDILPHGEMNQLLHMHTYKYSCIDCVRSHMLMIWCISCRFGVWVFFVGFFFANNFPFLYFFPVVFFPHFF